MHLDLTDFVAIVTGATSGIGLATTHRLASEGATVIAVARRDPPPHTLPNSADFVAADITHPETATLLTGLARERHGRLNGLVNNAAHFATRDSTEEIDDALWRDTFELNLFALARLARVAAPAMRCAGGGSIVHLGSEAGRMPDPTMAAYAASKAAVLSLSKSLAIEYGPAGIRSNVVSPGPTLTALFEAPGGLADQLAVRFGTDPATAVDRFIREERRLPVNKIGSPEAVADLIVYLLSPRADQVTGAEWSVDGGALRQI